MTQMRLRAYTPNGPLLGPLPLAIEISASWVFNDLGVLQFSYPFRGAKSEYMGSPMEVGVEVLTPSGDWVEPDSGRFMYTRDSREPSNDNDPWQADCLPYVTRLRKAVVGLNNLDRDGRRTYSGKTAGFIMNNLMNEAQARGALTGMPWAFTALADSTGAAWTGPSSNITVSYEPGRDLLSIVQEMAALGWIDFTTRGRALRLAVAGNDSTDTTVNSRKVIVRRGQGVTELPFRRTWENVADTAIVRGDRNTSTTRTIGTQSAWGVQEVYVAAGGVTDAATLAAMGDAALALTAGPRSEYTVGLGFGLRDPNDPTNANTAYPFREFDLGDWIYLTDPAVVDGAAGVVNSQVIRVRVRQISLSRDKEGKRTGTLVVNDRFTESDVAAQRTLDGLTNGSVSAVGMAGSGRPPTAVPSEYFAGGEAVSFGSSPPAGTVKRVAEGTIVLQTGANGAFTIPMPGTAWSGYTSVILSPGDVASNLGFVRPIPGSFTTGTIVGQALSAAAAVVASGLNIRVNYRVVGW